MFIMYSTCNYVGEYVRVQLDYDIIIELVDSICRDSADTQNIAYCVQGTCVLNFL